MRPDHYATARADRLAQALRDGSARLYSPLRLWWERLRKRGPDADKIDLNP